MVLLAVDTVPVVKCEVGRFTSEGLLIKPLLVEGLEMGFGLANREQLGACTCGLEEAPGAC